MNVKKKNSSGSVGVVVEACLPTKCSFQAPHSNDGKQNSNNLVGDRPVGYLQTQLRNELQMTSLMKTGE